VLVAVDSLLITFLVAVDTCLVGILLGLVLRPAAGKAARERDPYPAPYDTERLGNAAGRDVAAGDIARVVMAGEDAKRGEVGEDTIREAVKVGAALATGREDTSGDARAVATGAVVDALVAANGTEVPNVRGDDIMGAATEPYVTGAAFVAPYDTGALVVPPSVAVSGALVVPPIVAIERHDAKGDAQAMLTGAVVVVDP